MGDRWEMDSPPFLQAPPGSTHVLLCSGRRRAHESGTKRTGIPKPSPPTEEPRQPPQTDAPGNTDDSSKGSIASRNSPSPRNTRYPRGHSLQKFRLAYIGKARGKYQRPFTHVGKPDDDPVSHSKNASSGSSPRTGGLESQATTEALGAARSQGQPRASARSGCPLRPAQPSCHTGAPRPLLIPQEPSVSPDKTTSSIDARQSRTFHRERTFLEAKHPL